MNNDSFLYAKERAIIRKTLHIKQDAYRIIREQIIASLTYMYSFYLLMWISSESS